MLLAVVKASTKKKKEKEYVLVYMPSAKLTCG